FKLVDQLSGRSMGVRADMTPQVTRIDAHLLNRAGTTRLCYYGSVLHALPRGLWATREPLQIGAELYGHAGQDAGVEVVQLGLASVQIAGMSGYRLVLSHLGVLRALLALHPVPQQQCEVIFTLLRDKDVPGLAELSAGLSETCAQALQALPTLYGGVASVLERARSVLPGLPAITKALDELASLAAAFPNAPVGIDLADARGFHYHTGVFFAVYCEGWPNAVIR